MSNTTQYSFIPCLTLTICTCNATLSYSAEMWTNCPGYIAKELEKAYKQMIYSVLEVSEKTKFSAILLETGMMRMEHVIAQLQLTFMSKVVWDDVDSLVHKVVMLEYQILGEKSSLGAVDKLAAAYGMDPVSKVRLDHKAIKQTVRKVHNAQVWKDCFMSSIVKTRPYFRIKDRSFYNWTKWKTKALLAWRTGALKFKTALSVSGLCVVVRMIGST